MIPPNGWGSGDPDDPENEGEKTPNFRLKRVTHVSLVDAGGQQDSELIPIAKRAGADDPPASSSITEIMDSDDLDDRLSSIEQQVKKSAESAEASKEAAQSAAESAEQAANGGAEPEGENGGTEPEGNGSGAIEAVDSLRADLTDAGVLEGESEQGDDPDPQTEAVDSLRADLIDAGVLEGESSENEGGDDPQGDDLDMSDPEQVEKRFERLENGGSRRGGAGGIAQAGESTFANDGDGGTKQIAKSIEAGNEGADQ